MPVLLESSSSSMRGLSQTAHGPLCLAPIAPRTVSSYLVLLNKIVKRGATGVAIAARSAGSLWGVAYFETVERRRPGLTPVVVAFRVTLLTKYSRKASRTSSERVRCSSAHRRSISFIIAGGSETVIVLVVRAIVLPSSTGSRRIGQRDDMHRVPRDDVKRDEARALLQRCFRVRRGGRVVEDARLLGACGA